MTMAIGYPKDWVSKRTTLEEAPSMSKAVRRYGVNGSRLDSTHGSTGGHEAHESEIAPSIAPRHVGRIGPPRSEVVGHDPSGSGKWLSPTHDKELIGNAIETHAPLKPQGQTFDASGGKFGKKSHVPEGKSEGHRHIIAPPGTVNYRTRTDAGALAGDSHPRRSYSGGPGPIKP
jgi:hypothetical protein